MMHPIVSRFFPRLDVTLKSPGIPQIHRPAQKRGQMAIGITCSGVNHVLWCVQQSVMFGCFRIR